MLHLSEITNPSPLILKRARAMWAVKSSETARTIAYKVTPHGKDFGHRDKDRREVVFDLLNETAECVSLETGEVCPANADFVPGQPDRPKMPHLCSHCWCAFQRFERLMESRARRAA